MLTLTSLPGDEIPEWEIPHIDKIVHFLMYLVLSLSLARALTGKIRETVSWTRYSRRLIFCILCIFIFGAIDEWHQQFVPGREMSLADWFMDALGALLGALLTIQYRRWVLRLEHRNFH